MTNWTGKPLVSIFDIDGTISNPRHRLHFIEGKKKDWDSFYKACEGDAAIYPVIHILKALHRHGHEIWFFTGRRDNIRTETIRWLDRFDIPYHHLIMRPDSDRTEDYKLKRQWLDQYFKDDKHRIVAVYEDRSRNVKMFREEGLVCLQVADGDF